MKGPVRAEQPSRAMLLRKDRMEHYRRHRNAVGEKLLRAILRAQATIEAAQMVNDLLEQQGLLDVNYDLEKLVPSTETIVQLEMNAILAQHAYLPRSTKEEFVRRVTARMAPLRDVVGARPDVAPSELARRPDLGGQISREAERLRRGRDR